MIFSFVSLLLNDFNPFCSVVLFFSSFHLNYIANIFHFFHNFFAVFYNSGFKITLCGRKWDPDPENLSPGGLTGDKNAFNNLGTSAARYGCCPVDTYMSSPEDTGTFDDAVSCSICPAGTHKSELTSAPNDATSCQLCESGKSSEAGSDSCLLTTIKLPDGNGEDRGDGTLGRIVDDILGTDISKKVAATKTYGPIKNWDVSDVTDISYLFAEKGTMNADLSSWDVSRVTNIHAST